VHTLSLQVQVRTDAFVCIRQSELMTFRPRSEQHLHQNVTLETSWHDDANWLAPVCPRVLFNLETQKSFPRTWSVQSPPREHIAVHFSTFSPGRFLVLTFLSLGTD